MFKNSLHVQCMKSIQDFLSFYSSRKKKLKKKAKNILLLFVLDLLGKSALSFKNFWLILLALTVPEKICLKQLLYEYLIEFICNRVSRLNDVLFKTNRCIRLLNLRFIYLGINTSHFSSCILTSRSVKTRSLLCLFSYRWQLVCHLHAFNILEL